MKATEQIRLSDHFTYGKLLRVTLPSIVMMIFTSAYGVVDGLFVSNFAGKTPFAAVNFIMPVLMLLSTPGFLWGTGGSALVATRLGRGEKRRANELFSMFLYVTVACGAVLGAAGFVLIPRIAAAMVAAVQLLPLWLGIDGVRISTVAAEVMAVLVGAAFLLGKRKKYGY